VEFQYKFENGRVYVRALRYHMTTRSGNWYRANIAIGLSAQEFVRKDSPDSMSQDTQWHNYPPSHAYVDSRHEPSGAKVTLSIRVDYDGTNNDVGPNEGWGTSVDLTGSKTESSI